MGRAIRSVFSRMLLGASTASVLLNAPAAHGLNDLSGAFNSALGIARGFRLSESSSSVGRSSSGSSDRDHEPDPPEPAPPPPHLDPNSAVYRQHQLRARAAFDALKEEVDEKNAAIDVFNHGLKLAHRGEYEDAEDELEDAADKLDDQQSRFALGWVNYLQGDYSDAIDWYEECSGRDAELNLAWCLYRMDEPLECIEKLEAMRRLRGPNDPGVAYLMGLAAFQVAHEPRDTPPSWARFAVDELSRLLDPANAWSPPVDPAWLAEITKALAGARLVLGAELFDRKEPGAAVREFELALNALPEADKASAKLALSAACWEYGKSLCSNGQSVDGAEMLEKAFVTSPREDLKTELVAYYDKRLDELQSFRQGLIAVQEENLAYRAKVVESLEEWKALASEKQAELARESSKFAFSWLIERQIVITREAGQMAGADAGETQEKVRQLGLLKAGVESAHDAAGDEKALAKMLEGALTVGSTALLVADAPQLAILLTAHKTYEVTKVAVAAGSYLIVAGTRSPVPELDGALRSYAKADAAIDLRLVAVQDESTHLANHRSIVDAGGLPHIRTEQDKAREKVFLKNLEGFSLQREAQK